jgi:hypothetical protein
MRLTVAEFNDLFQGWCWREEHSRRVTAHFVVALMNRYRLSKGMSRMTVNKLVGRPKFVRIGEPERAARPGQDGWIDYLDGLPEAHRRRLQERMRQGAR